jgi:hypothetical protein
MNLLRTLALPLAVLSLAVVPVRADEPSPAERAPVPRPVAPDVPPLAGEGPRVRLVTRVIDVVAGVAARWRSPTTPAWRVLTGAEVARLLERQNENVITSADTQVLIDQRSTLEVLHKTAYVADYDVEVSMGDYIADPIVKTVVAGTVLDTVPSGSADRIVLRLKLQHTWLLPMRTECVSAHGSEVKIQFPEVAGRTWQGEVSVPRGGHLLLLGAEGLPSENAKARLLLVTPTLVPEAAPSK